MKQDQTLQFHFKEELSREEIYERMSEEGILRLFYNKDIYFGRNIRSPVRDDKNPSFAFYLTKNNRIRYKDFSTGDNGDIFRFISKLTGKGYYDILRIISEYITENNIEKIETCKFERQSVEIKKNITTSIRDFNQNDLKYWKKMFITKEMLNFYKIEAIQNIYKIDEYGRVIVIYDNNPIDPAYKLNFTESQFKIYRPLTTEKSVKFISKVSADTIYGIEQYVKKVETHNKDLLIITKSIKDIMVLDLLGYNSIAYGSESYIIPEKHVRTFRNTYKRIVILYDNDKTGIEFSNKLASMYNLEQLFLTVAKDIADIACICINLTQLQEVWQKEAQKILTPQ